MTVPDAIRRALAGADGPEVRIPPAVAYFLAPPVRDWWERAGARGADSDLLREHVAALLWAAQLYEDTALSGSAGSGNGTAAERGRTVQSIIDDERWMTTAQAAERWAIGERAVRKRCDQDQVPGARKHAGSWFLPAAEVERQATQGDQPAA